MNLALLHLCDSLFPLGAFAYSDGLEAAATVGVDVASDFSRTLDRDAIGELRRWIDVCLDDTIGRLEGPAVWRAWGHAAAGDWDAIAMLDAELIALRPSSSARQSSRAMGQRLLATWQALYPDPRLEHALARPSSLPIAFGAVCACAGIDRVTAVESYAYTRLAATISAAMRLVAIGQGAAHQLLARAVERIPAVARDAAGREPESFTPLMDIAVMSQQHLHSRLFRS